MNTSFWRSVYKNCDSSTLKKCNTSVFVFNINFKTSQFFLHCAVCIISLKITLQFSTERLLDTQSVIVAFPFR